MTASCLPKSTAFCFPAARPASQTDTRATCSPPRALGRARPSPSIHPPTSRRPTGRADPAEGGQVIDFLKDLLGGIIREIGVALGMRFFNRRRDGPKANTVAYGWGMLTLA